MLSLGMAEIKQEINSTQEAINKDDHICGICYTQTGTAEINPGAKWVKSHHEFYLLPNFSFTTF